MGMYADDWAILATLCLGVPGTVVLCTQSVPNGSGKDVWTVPFNQIDEFGKWFFFMEVQYFVDLAVLKLSLLLFYLRIFPSTTIKRLLWGTVVFVGVYGVVFAIAALVQCQPLHFFWTKWDGQHQGHCVNVNAIGWANAGISIALDFWMLALPLSQLQGLQLHWKKKIGVTLMFFVGTFVTVVSILRLHALVTFATSDNPTFDNFDTMLWSTLEINTGIICACMPALRQILARISPTVFGGEQSRQRYYRYGKGDNHVATIGSKDIVPPPKGRTEWWQGLSLSRASMFVSQRMNPAVARAFRDSTPVENFPTKGIQVNRSVQVDDERPTSVPMQNLKPYAQTRGVPTWETKSSFDPY
ncbi:hypothetical protein diail_6241 [Diaporthe ilicicola]|nr:hypothetical protein diail_6241 [Diaporthe ilicicola]